MSEIIEELKMRAVGALEAEREKIRQEESKWLVGTFNVSIEELEIAGVEFQTLDYPCMPCLKICIDGFWTHPVTTLLELGREVERIEGLKAAASAEKKKEETLGLVNCAWKYFKPCVPRTGQGDLGQCGNDY